MKLTLMPAVSESKLLGTKFSLLESYQPLRKKELSTI